MRVIAIQSSPNLDGLTASLAQAFLKGVEAEGGQTELIHLNRMDIKPCIACEQGWGRCRTEGICILKDDFEALMKKIAEADALVFATPVYFGDLSESARLFLDRLRRCEAFSGLETFKGKKVVGIASAGGSGGGAVRALHNLEHCLRRVQFEIYDLVAVTKSSKDHKLQMLEKAGRYLVKGESPTLRTVTSLTSFGTSRHSTAGGRTSLGIPPPVCMIKRGRTKGYTH